MRLNFLYITTVYGVDFLLWNFKNVKKEKNINCKFFLSGFYIFATFLAKQRNCI